MRLGTEKRSNTAFAATASGGAMIAPDEGRRPAEARHDHRDGDGNDHGRKDDKADCEQRDRPGVVAEELPVGRPSAREEQWRQHREEYPFGRDFNARQPRNQGQRSAAHHEHDRVGQIESFCEDGERNDRCERPEEKERLTHRRAPSVCRRGPPAAAPNPSGVCAEPSCAPRRSSCCPIGRIMSTFQRRVVVAASFALATSLAACTGGASSGGDIVSVNGTKISRADFDHKLESAPTAKQVLTQMVGVTLVDQYARDNKVEVSDAEIDKKENEIKSRYPPGQFDQILKPQNLTEDDVRTILRQQTRARKGRRAAKKI